MTTDAETRSSEETSENTNVVIPANTVNDLSTKKQLRKILREDSNWSIKSISIAGMTGVSVALISTQLTSLVSSIVLIAIMAFISATVSEFYRIFVALSTLGAKKVASKTPLQISNLADRTSAQSGNRTSSESSSSSADTSPLSSSGNSVSTVEESDPITDALHVITQAYQLPADEEQTVGRFRRGFSRIRNYTRANHFLMLILLFLGVSLATVGASYALSNGDPKTVWQTIVVKEEVSDVQKKELISEAVKEATPVVTHLVSQSELNSMATEVASLTASVEDLKKALGKMNLDQADAAKDTSSFEKRVSELEVERGNLARKVSELEAKLKEVDSKTTVDVDTVPTPEASPSTEVSQSPSAPRSLTAPLSPSGS